MLMACSPLNCVQVSPNASTYGMSSRIVNELGCISYAWIHFHLPGRRLGTPSCALEIFEFSSGEFFFNQLMSLSLFVYGRARVTMEGKTDVPMSIPVTVYWYLGILRSSLGKEMARADISTSSLWMVSTDGLGSWTFRDTSCMSEREFFHAQNNRSL